MSAVCGGWIKLQICVVAAFCQQDLTTDSAILPTLKTERIEIVETAGSGEGAHRFLVSLADSMRNRHFEIRVDQSVCRGKLRVNQEEFTGENATDRFRFDRANEITVEGCLERTPRPIEVLAFPKVFIAAARAMKGRTENEVRIDVTIRNTLANSVSCILTAIGREEEFFLGPETSQTRSFWVHLSNRQESPIPLELLKLPEAIEGGYRHLESIGKVIR